MLRLPARASLLDTAALAPRISRLHRLTAAALCVVSLPAAAFTRPTLPPEPDSTGDALVTKYTYDDAGRQQDVIDNAGMVTRSQYDALGRVTATIENYVDGTPGGSADDEDRTTTYAYNAAGQITEQTADLPGTADDQSTYYIYSADLSTPGSVVPNHSLLRAVVYPDAGFSSRSAAVSAINSSSTTDYVDTTYYADGSLATRTDQRGVELTYTYDDAGRRTQQAVTAAPAGSVAGDLAMTYTYTDLGQLESVTTHDSANPGSGTETSTVTYAYNGLQQPLTEAQDHHLPGGYPTSGPLAGTPTFSWTYHDYTTGPVFTRNHRVTAVTYPNGRKLHTLYDAAVLGTPGSGGYGSIADALSRANGLADDDGFGLPGDTLLAYARTGDGRTVVKDLPRIAVRMDHHQQLTGDDPYDYLPGLDRFGRLMRVRWDRYDPDPAVNAAAHASLADPVFDLRHGYDRASNRLYSHDKVYVNDSDVYGHDDLHRLTTLDRGNLAPGTNGAPPTMAQLEFAQHWGLDALGNWASFQQDDDGGTAASPSGEWDLEQTRTHNQANEILSILGLAPGGNTGAFTPANSSDPIVMEAEHYTSRLAQNGQAWQRIEYGTSSPRLQTSAQHWWAPPTDPKFIATLTFTIPEAGDYLIWGFVNPEQAGRDSVWMQIDGGSWFRWENLQAPGGYGLWYWDTVHDSGNGDATVVSSFTAGTHTIKIAPNERLLSVDKFYITKAGDTPDYDHVADTAPGLTLEAESAALASPTDWIVETGRQDIDASNGLVMRALPDAGNNHDAPTYLTASPRLDYDIDFPQTGTYTVNVLGRALPSPDNGTSDSVHADLNAQGQASADRLGNFNDYIFRWLHGSMDGGNVTVNVPSAGVHTLNLWMREDGFSADKILLYPGNVNTFPQDFGPAETPRAAGQGTPSGGDPLPEPQYDAAGNLVLMPVADSLDGGGDWTTVLAAEYDAWNRLTKISHATPAPGTGNYTVGDTLATMTYDGLGRRITRTVTNTPDSGAFDYAYHYYYLGQSIAETRNGSNLVAKQHIWAGEAGGYIDEFVEVRINQDPTDPTEQLCERQFYAVHNAQYNVLGLLQPIRDEDFTLVLGQRLVERYTYTPYGQRQVYRHGWILEDVTGDGIVDGLDQEAVYSNQNAYGELICDLSGDGSRDTADTSLVDAAIGTTLPQNDPLVTIPADHSFRDAAGIALNEIGHQGLPHDEESGPICNRARMLNPQLGRFVQRDPLSTIIVPKPSNRGRRGEFSGDRTSGPDLENKDKVTQHGDVSDYIDKSSTDSFMPPNYPDGLNLYQYVQSMPLIRVDSYGLESCACKNYQEVNDKADNDAANSYPRDGDPKTERKRNATRHCLKSCRLARTCDPQDAWNTLASKEDIRHIVFKPNDTRADLINNRRGISGAISPELSDYSCDQICDAFLNLGYLNTDPIPVGYKFGEDWPFTYDTNR